MKYHLFRGVTPIKDGSWCMFLYKDPETCVEKWSYDPRFGITARKITRSDIPIDKRIFILSTTQHGMVRANHTHEEVSEAEAYFMMFDT